MRYLFLTYNQNWKNKNIIKLNYSNNLYNLETDNEVHSEYIYIYKIILRKKYILPFKNIINIFDTLCNNEIMIEKLEKIYNVNFFFLKELHKYIILSNTYNVFINANEGLLVFNNILKYELPILGIDILKTYSTKEIIEVNNYMLLTYLLNLKKDKDENLELFNKFIDKY